MAGYYLPPKRGAKTYITGFLSRYFGEPKAKYQKMKINQLWAIYRRIMTK